MKKSLAIPLFLLVLSVGACRNDSGRNDTGTPPSSNPSSSQSGGAPGSGDASSGLSHRREALPASPGKPRDPALSRVDKIAPAALFYAA
jgi:hypothetical protein